MEHRWGHRHEVSRPVHLDTRAGLAARGVLKNVSISGGFIVTPLPIGVYAHVRVQFTQMIDGKRSIISIEAQVVRRDGMGIGIEWSELAPEFIRAVMIGGPMPRDSAPAPSGRPPRSNHRLHR